MKLYALHYTFLIKLQQYKHENAEIITFYLKIFGIEFS